MSARGSVVVLSPGGGHARRLVPLVAGLVARGLDVHVMTRAEVGGQFEAAGAVFHDLFARYSIDAVDCESIPLPSRFVTFAAAYAEPLAADVAELKPRLLVYDSFIVVAPLIARRLGIPYVGMRAGHAQVPDKAVDDVQRDPRVAISAACREAVETLQKTHGMLDASPFSYLRGLSPHLNLYPEPAPFLEEEARRAFEPIAFFRSLAPATRDAEAGPGPLWASDGRMRVYVSFGTAIWRYYADVALRTMATVADAFARDHAEVLVSMGGYSARASDRRKIERPHVRVETYLNQWGALKDADLFVTHHGLNSTHEAVFHQVPMLSYPFFGDQPSMAECCQKLGLAVALSKEPRALLNAAAVEDAIDIARRERERLAARLSAARGWEIDTIEARGAVLDRMLALA